LTTRARGVFVVLEGADGSGKSTQARMLVERLRDEAPEREILATFEPGATPLGAAIRGIVLGTHDQLDPHAEALLIAADRAQHVATVVRPALDRGAIVVSDRFVPSSIAYQGRGRGLGVDAVVAVNRWATAELEADVVVVLDTPAGELTARRPVALDRVERAGDEFHAAVRAAYVDLASSMQWTVVDGGGDVDVVADRVWRAVAPVIGLAAPQ